LAKLAGGDALERNCAVILYSTRAGQSPRVAHYAANLQTAAAGPWLARRLGIRLDMPLAEARALITATEPPRVEAVDRLADRAELEALAQWCQRFSPTVALDEGAWDGGTADERDEPESLLLDATGIGELFGGERALAHQIVQAFAQRQLAARVAMADTWAAAWALANFAPLELASKPVPGGTPARSASEGTSRVALPRLRFGLVGEYNADPNAAAILAALASPVIVPAGQTSAAIGPLSIQALRLPQETCGLLAELGIERIEQLMRVRRSTLRSRFGPAVLDALDRATGAAAEALDAQAAPAELEFEHLLEHATSRREMIEWVLEQLIERACATLAAQERGLLRFECRFESEAGTSAGFIVGLYRPSAQRRHVGELVRLKLERLRLQRSVTAVRLSVLATDRLERVQQEMFVPEDAVARDAPREVAALVDRLSNRLGSRRVLGVQPSAGALPEFACRFEPMASLTSGRRKKSTTAKTRTRKAQPGKTRAEKNQPRVSDAPRPPGDRPLYLEPRPVAVSVVSVAPEGPPMQFRLAGREHRTSRVWGPERFETAWWRSRCVRRDYYQVETGTGQRFWMFRQLATGRWFLHGEFA
jgi:protein ImuB